MSGFTVTRFHDFSAGHRVCGHENKCRHLHGHNYRVHFTCEPDNGVGLDPIGRVIDFSAINSRLGEWLEKEWDHKMLLWKEDPVRDHLLSIGAVQVTESIVTVPFNPTAENMASYLITAVGPVVLKGTNTRLCRVHVEETRKCSATYTR